MKYVVLYSSAQAGTQEWESNSRNAVRHLFENYRAGGSDRVAVFFARQWYAWHGEYHDMPRAVSRAQFSPDGGGRFIRVQP